jgi:glycine/D-amino acid oxidase-like deaminating enzyme
MDLVEAFVLSARLGPPEPIGAGPFGTRRIRPVVGGEVTGERINGVVTPGGADWVLVGPDGWGRLDVRLTIRTADGAHLYVQYFGVIEYNDAALAANAGERTADYGEFYFRTAPRIETGDDRYDWVNRCVFLGEGRLHPGPVVEYRVYRVT